MKKLLFTFWLIIIVSVLSMLGCEKKAEDKKPYRILTKNVEKMTLCYLEHVGPYDQMGALFAQLGEYAAKKQLAGEIVGIYYDDPDMVAAENLKSEIGVVVPDGFEPDSGYKIQEVPSRRVVYAILKGPYEEIAQEYDHIQEWIEDKEYKVIGPVMEIYLEVGPDVPPEQLVTEVQIPIEEQ
jgi:AraC family transcriptional regulator